jgi:hypothetical protein
MHTNSRATYNTVIARLNDPRVGTQSLTADAVDVGALFGLLVHVYVG